MYIFFVVDIYILVNHLIKNKMGGPFFYLWGPFLGLPPFTKIGGFYY